MQFPLGLQEWIAKKMKTQMQSVILKRKTLMKKIPMILMMTPMIQNQLTLVVNPLMTLKKQETSYMRRKLRFQSKTNLKSPHHKNKSKWNKWKRMRRKQ